RSRSSWLNITTIITTTTITTTITTIIIIITTITTITTTTTEDTGAKRALCIGLDPAWLRQPLVRSTRFWGFLGGACYVAKAPSSEGWIALDFLGFSRLNLDFSMGYTDFSVNNFSSRSPRWGGAGRVRSIGPVRKARLVIGPV